MYVFGEPLTLINPQIYKDSYNCISRISIEIITEEVKTLLQTFSDCKTRTKAI